MTGILNDQRMVNHVYNYKVKTTHIHMIHEHLPFSFLNIYITYPIDFLLLSAFANPPPQGR